MAGYDPCNSFHVLGAEDIYDLKKLEGKKKSISAFFSMMAKQMEHGIAAGGGVVAELEADVIVSARDDIMSQVDKAGRRWVEMMWFANQTRGGTGPKFAKVERDLNVLIRDLVLKYLEPILGNKARTEPEFYLWADMKRHLKDSKKLSLVIKDYFDGVEKVIKANKEVMSSIFYGYARSKRQTDNAWDEQIVNNIKIKKVHILSDEVDLDRLHDMYPKGLVREFPDVKFWDASIDLEIYTRQVVAKEIGRKI